MNTPNRNAGHPRRWTNNDPNGPLSPTQSSDFASDGVSDDKGSQSSDGPNAGSSDADGPVGNQHPYRNPTTDTSNQTTDHTTTHPTTDDATT